MEFKELTLEELTLGYAKSAQDASCTCIFCGEIYEAGIVYRSRGRMVTAERAVQEHIFDQHGGVFRGLLYLDKQVNGLSQIQKDVLTGMYLEKDNKQICEEMGISAATVRSHKFNLQKSKREAKILLALLEQIEDESIVKQRKIIEGETPAEEEMPVKKDFSGNTLHPFFTQYNLK